MEAHKEKTIETGKVTKSVPMEDKMITEIHKLMAEHLQKHNRAISFGEATRRVIMAGLENIKKIGWLIPVILLYLKDRKW